MHLFPLLCAVGVVDDVNFGVDEHIGSDSRVLESRRRSVSWPDMKRQAFRSRFQKLSRSPVCKTKGRPRRIKITRVTQADTMPVTRSGAVAIHGGC